MNSSSIGHGSTRDVQNFEIKGNKPNCSGYRIRAKCGDTLNNVRSEASRQFWYKTREYPKDKINELATSSGNKNIRGLHREINKFKKVYQPRT
jgi:hypothetical protein